MAAGKMRAGMPLALTLGLLLALMLAIAFVALAHDVIDEINALTRSVQRTLIVDGAGSLRKEVGRIETSKQNLAWLLEQLDKSTGADDDKTKELYREVRGGSSAYLVSLSEFTQALENGK